MKPYFIACCLTFLTLLNLTSVNAQDDDEIISVDSSIVVLNASIFDSSGRSVPGLTAKQFRVFEDGVEQPIRTIEAEQTPFAAIILLDTSGSMESRVSLARSAAIQFLQGLRI